MPTTTNIVEIHTQEIKFIIKMLSYQYKKFHCGYKTAISSSVSEMGFLVWFDSIIMMNQPT